MSAWAGLVSGAHGMIALLRQEQHWLLSEADAKIYGTALGNAMRHLPVAVAQKYIDFSAAIMVAFQMDAPRIMLSVRARQQAKEPPKPSAVVYPMSGFATASPGTLTPPGTSSPPHMMSEGIGGLS